MKVKQKVESRGKFYEPDIKELLVPEVISCPECGNLIYPYEDDKDKTYYFPNMTNEHRYHTRHFARATFTCAGCGCKFSRTANTYTEFNLNKIKLDISKILMASSITSLILSSFDTMAHDDFDTIHTLISILTFSIFLGSIIYYWRNS